MSSKDDEIEIVESTQADEAESMDTSCVSDCSNKENEAPLDYSSSDDFVSSSRTSLLESVCNGKQSKQGICESWIRLYRHAPVAALVQFMQFVLEASGSLYQMPSGKELPFNYSEVLIAATARFGNCLMDLCHSAGLLFDDMLLKNMISFLLVCVDSKVRAFRHTSTLIALKMMTALCNIVSVEGKQLKDMWSKLFEGVFLERSIDVVDEIRFLCLSECGLWMEKYPQRYLIADYVKHLFLALQDNAAKVVESCFMSLLKLYKNPQLRAACLELGFTYRMTLLGLTMSAESELGQMAVELLGLFYKANPLMLDESMLQVIEQLVFAAHRGVAQAAADVVPYRYKETNSREEAILMLARFFLRFEEHEHAAYLVDAYYGRNDVVLDWSRMVSMLLLPEPLDRAECSAIIEILTRSIKQAVTGEIPPGRYAEELVREAQPNAKKKATSVLLNKLPKLLRQFYDSNPDLTNLLELPQFMSLHHKQFGELLEHIKDIMFEQQDGAVLQMGAMTLKHLYCLNASHGNHCKELLNSAVTNYMIAATAWDQSIAGNSRVPMKENAKRLLDTLRLLSTLYARFDLYEWQLTDNALVKLQNAVDDWANGKQDSESCLSAESISFYLTTIYVSFSWDLMRVKETAKAGKDVSAECRNLRRRLDNFLSVSFQLIERGSLVQMECDAFTYACDIFVLFSDSLRRSSCTPIRSLECKSNINDYKLIESFVLRFVFVGGIAELLPAEMFPLLQSKRRILASYCKLVFNNVMPVMRACIVLQYYDSFYPVFGDILRSTLERCLSVNPTNFGMTLMHTCLLVYKRVRLAFPDPQLAAASSDFADLLKLADVLAEVFNTKQLEVRSGVLVLHRAGIRFAAEEVSADATRPPKDLLFLTVIQQFVPQLLAQDMMDVLKSLEVFDHGTLPQNRTNDWLPLLTYRNTLELALMQSCRRDELYNLPSNVVD
ncbi:hypothetical protein AWZ03_006218 [Drosophila navojoa]|uniref:SCD domain-containing protein n=1 Tax=Drosophila navojoa TaxID=7232 RepID=A0A484BF53_DRONA|nr:hypothetical protein AWZ03_006218 [Drosophila navojoa]